MTASYDIGVGRCSEVGQDYVLVKVDAVIGKKLAPDDPWRRSGTSLLRCDRKFCSPRRTPQVGEELYLDSAAIARQAAATLDVLGDGRFRDVDLKNILSGPPPMAASAPTQTQRLAFHRRGK
jgi:hypothetical protein